MSVASIGAVLAGGRSSRFGTDKALAILDGKPLIDHVIERLAAQVDMILVCGRSHGHHHRIEDRPRPGLGPLGGLNAALHHGREIGARAILTVGCDMPTLPLDLFARLAGNGAAVVAETALIGYWPTDLADQLDAYLAHGPSRAMRHWAAYCGARTVHIPDDLANVNTRADLARLTESRQP